MNKIKITMVVNKKPVEVEVEPYARLLDVLRDAIGLTGVKEGCGVGECGACTIIMNSKKVNSCMILAAQAQDAEILTIEGMENPDGSLHPIQEAFIEAGAVQCGFCTPGMVLSGYQLLNKISNPDEMEIKEAISGNLCRCTGYKQIVDAVKLAGEKMKECPLSPKT
ncbi:MAG: (2Fe-2S)-binding protein [Bacteroidetes bacterium]|nr:(2Fe-2S)-binding protein [Bacteroidota bacterium]